jgi:trans-aconitate 2-methyltransferase
MSWSAAKYLAFEDERTRPARDLLAAVPSTKVDAAIDIGCGPGNSTEVLAARFPAARVSGIDSSEDMIAAARKRLPGMRFEVADIEGWIGAGRDRERGGPDLILANAVLQWLPRHADLFPALLARLAPGGCLAVQMPDNLAEPAQVLMREVAQAGPWRGRLGPADQARVRIEPAQWYYTMLRAANCAHVDVWRTIYHHSLPGENGIVDWFKATGLRPFLDPLAPAERADYLARYTARIKAAYPALPDGTVLLPFPRLFIIAVR